VVTDGRFDDWAGVEPVLEDPEDAPPRAAVDLGTLRLQDEPAYLHLDLEVRRPVNALGLRGTIRLLLDADGDPATGAHVEGLEGADVEVVLSPTDRPRDGGYGLGAGVRTVGDGYSGPLLPPARVGLLVAPTQASRRLELRLDRGFSLDGEGGGTAWILDGGLRLQVVYEAAEGVLDETAVARYELETVFRALPEPARIDLAKTDGTFRVVAWNVAGRGIGDDPEPFARVLSAIRPDVVLLDEAHGSLTRAELERFFALVDPVDPPRPWSWVMGESGRRQRGVVASRAPLRSVPSLVGPLPYPERSLNRLTEELGEEAFGDLARVETQAGLAVAGAWVTLEGAGGGGEAGELLFVPVDLQSRGYLGSPEDRLRSLQAGTIRDRVQEVLEGDQQGSGETLGARGLVVAGDFNLVGGWEPLERLATGLDPAGIEPADPDPEGIDLAVAECPTLDGRSLTTWRATNDAGSLFSPGRLDFHLYSASTLEQVRGFTFDAGALPVGQRRELGVREDDSRLTSDHLPVVADYRWRHRQ